MLELLVTMAIVVLLLTIALPTFSLARESARQTACAGKARRLGLLTQTHLQYHHNQFPEFFYAFSPGASGKVIVQIRPMPYQRGGLPLRERDLLVCPSDAQPTSFTLIVHDGPPRVTEPLPGSFWLNMDLAVRKPRGDELPRPDRTVVFYDGQQPLNPGGQPKIVFDSSHDFVTQSLAHRHGDRSKAVFADGHVEAVTALPPDRVYFDGAPGG